MPETTARELPFRRLGEYDVIAPISEGGMATVWLGRSTKHPEQVVALKVIRPEHARNKEFIAMFVDEARIASRLSHPNIIRIDGLGHDGKRHFLVMEVLRGHSLLQVWDAARAHGTRISRGLVAWMGARIADALHHAHELRDEKGAPQEVVHRDVSPSNVFLTKDGVPKLIDFGLARARDRLASTALGVVKGKLAYLAPEQVQGSTADRRSDVFALGVTLWEASLDRRLFREGSDAETVRRVREGKVPDPTTIDADFPAGLAQVLLHALARDPAERFQTAAELRDALDSWARESGDPVGEEALRDTLAPLFAGIAPAPWEAQVDEAAVGSERIRVWDDERQKLTWMNAAIDTVAPATTNGSAPHAAPVARNRRERLVAALDERLAGVDPEDRVTSARLHLEHALVEEQLGEARAAEEHARKSIATAPGVVAHALLRRLGHARGKAAGLLEHLEAELVDVAPGPARSDLLAERARLVAASGATPELVCAAWRAALEADPRHPAALRGLEGALSAEASDADERVAHLAQMAEAWTSEPALAAWLHVERSALLDRALHQVDGAKAALARALELDGGLGPVRAACVRHAVVHRDADLLVALLTQQAGLEADPARAAQLELDAGLVAHHRCGDADGATALLERAAARLPIAPSVRRRALGALVTLYTQSGRWGDVLRVRRARLTLIEDARARAHEQRSIAALEETSGNVVAAIAALERAIELAPEDETLAHDVDRLLGVAGLGPRRVELWSKLAATAPPGPPRARLLLRAATLAQGQNDVTRAVELARAALVAAPDDIGAVDLLLRLSPASPGEGRTAATERIAVHTHAAEHAVDPARRVAHLEAIATLQEEVLGDPAAAAATYETVLRLEKGRRTAVVGLARTAGRAGDRLRLSRALLDEAAAASDSRTADGLRVRAAEALPPLEAERALALVRDVLARDPDHDQARRVEQSLHEAAERWARVDETLAARIERASEPRALVNLWMARADLQRSRLRSPREAIAALRSALKVDPADPAAREALVTQLEATGEPKAVRDALVELAAGAASAVERADLLAHAAEIDELVLLDDAHASGLLDRATAEVPDDDWLAERRLRLLTRSARGGATGKRDLVAVLEARLARSPASADAAFTLATALLDDAEDPARALPVLEGMLTAHPAAPHVLRGLERVARATGSAPLLANALTQQGEAFTSVGPALGAMWSEAALVEWTLPGEGDTTSLVDRILRRAPADRAALDAGIRQAMALTRGGDADARARLVSTLRALLEAGPAAPERLWAHLTIALALEPEDVAVTDARTREALDAYRGALRIDAGSVVAAVGTARLAAALGDGEAIVASDEALADLAADPKRRATHLVHAAGQTLSSKDERLGTRALRLARAAEMLERALDADPQALPAVGLLVAVRTEEAAPRDVLLAVLRRAFERAKSPDVVLHVGAEVARVATIAPPDRVLAIEALRRMLEAAPGHTATLRALAEQYVAQQAWGEAVDALEHLAASARDGRAKVAALVDLADLHAQHLQRPVDAERALREALDVDPASVVVLQRLLAARRASAAPDAETLPLLERLADAETEPSAKAAALTSLAACRTAVGDAEGAERALVEAAVLAPTVERVTALLALHAGAPADQARSLEAVVTRAQEQDRPDATCLATLGRLEVDALGRYREGIAHLRVALALAPADHEARAALARGVVRMRGAAEAVGLLSPMVSPDPRPLLGLADPALALATLESALGDEGRADEGAVARELRALGGGLDDGAHAALRARRLPVDPRAMAPTSLDPRTLRGAVVPVDAPTLLLDVAAALRGIEGKLSHVALEDLGASTRSRLPGGPTGQPVVAVALRIAAMLELDRPEVAIGADVPFARAVMQGDTPWVIVPEGLVAQPEPVQVAAVARALTRVALAVPWLDELQGPYAHAVLCGAARQVTPDYASTIGDAGEQSMIDEMTKRIAKAAGRKQRKALGELSPALSSAPEMTLADARAFELAVARTELRVAFLVTGDLLATLDVARAMDGTLMNATAAVGPQALTAALVHPVFGDVARWALLPTMLPVRARVGSLWGGAR